jgi:hypothetical protein
VLGGFGGPHRRRLRRRATSQVTLTHRCGSINCLSASVLFGLDRRPNAAAPAALPLSSPAVKVEWPLAIIATSGKACDGNSNADPR